MKLKVVSLFSGYGTQELALKYLNIDYEVIAHSDICERVNKVYDSLHDSILGNLGDIKKVTVLPYCDLLTYSFPCQDISIAGKQKGVVHGTRSGLLFEVERLLNGTKPQYLFMENVKNLLSKKHKPVFDSHIKFLNSIGYGCGYKILNGGHYGCPQNRERVFMMSVKGLTNIQVQELMDQTKKDTVRKLPMRGFLETEVEDKLYVNCIFIPYNSNRISMCKMVGIRTDVKYQQKQRIYSIDHCSPTLTKVDIPQILLDNGKVRNTTPRENYRFMGVREEDIDLILSNGLSNRWYNNICGRSICVPTMMSIFKQFFKDEYSI